MDEVGEAISESSDVRPDAQGYAISCVCVCVSLQAHTVPVTAHWELARHKLDGEWEVRRSV